MILQCGQCGSTVKAEFVADYKYTYLPDVESTVTFWKCPECNHPFVTDIDKIFGLMVLYPPPDIQLNPELPNKLHFAYEEALSCYKAKAYTATAIMCRKILEGICAEQGVKGKNLVKSLKELRDKGIIENRLYEWADVLRVSGNEAAHDAGITISSEDAWDILEFTNSLLEYIFVFRGRFEEFKKRRSARPSKQETDTEVPY